MREIKFRVWSGGMWLDGNDANIHCISDSLHDTDIELCASHGIVDYVMCQYTGLLDKSGKEIYEGDIVGVWDDRTIKKHWKILVKFGEVDFHRDAYTNCIGFFGTEVGCSMPQGLNSALTYQRCEVIGNVYENPELMKEDV